MTINKKIEEKKTDFIQALEQFGKAISAHRNEKEDLLYQAALVQYFEIVSELAWKVLRDILIHEGIENTNTPRSVLKEALKAEFITNGDLWMRVIDDRNKTSHIYSEEIAQDVLKNIDNDYEKLFANLKDFLGSYKIRTQ